MSSAPSTSSSIAYAAVASSVVSSGLLLAGGLALRSRGYRLTQAGSARASQTAEVLSELRSSRAQLDALNKAVSTSAGQVQTSLGAQERNLSAALLPHLTDLSSSLASIKGATGDVLSSNKDLSSSMSEFQTLLSGPKTRGVFGEQALEALVSDCLPPTAYEFQASLPHPDGKTVRPDCLLTLPSPIDRICVDAKFPLDAYRDLLAAGDPKAQAEARKRMKTHMTKHIIDVSSKYNIPPVTSAAGSLLFLPSEAVFSELVARHPDVLALAHSRRVWVCSPTTLMAVLTTMRGVVRDHSLQKRAQEVFGQLELVMKDVDNLLKKRDMVDKNFEKAKESLRLLEVSAEKVRRRGLVMRNLADGLEEEQKELEEVAAGVLEEGGQEKAA
ncbi:hypothetical protein TeGR_g3667 [Tetraparma gracilis]|uniref:DNA recombination protein RmuC homolog n=1 Tax=Tetraparma gracilis TaxID=2962635 RepID=A0ABQ6N2S4_9STRA|nr:hypothetical protein TeGR_g3667 [Tetraparma gracilis]